MSNINSDNAKGTPMAAGALVIGALAVLILLNRGLRTVTASVSVGG